MLGLELDYMVRNGLLPYKILWSGNLELSVMLIEIHRRDAEERRGDAEKSIQSLCAPSALSASLR